MSDFVKEFSIEEVVKSSNKRRFIAYGSVEIYDRHNQMIPITEFYKSMDDYMSNSRILLDQHSNKPVGKVLNWTKAEKDGKPAIKITGEIFKDTRSADRVWKEIQNGEREGISVGGNTESISKDDMGEVLRGIQIDEFSIVKRCGNQGATFEVISMAKSEDNCVPEGEVEKEDTAKYVKKQTNDMEQTTQDDVNIQENERLDDLEQKYELLLNELSNIKSLLTSKPTNLSDMEVEKMEVKQEEIKKEDTPVTNEEVVKTETPVTEEVQKQEEVVQEQFDIKKFADTIQEQLNNLSSQILDLKKSSDSVQEVTNIVKTEAPVVDDVVSQSNKVSDIMKQLDKGEITREEAFKQISSTN